MTLNIAAVARKARVSTATVSRTINGLSTVHPKTAEKVNRAIAALGFHPDVNARALGSGRSNLYGLIISDITNPFFPELVKAFDDLAITHRREILIANTDYDTERMETCVSRMLQRRVDGVAIMTSEMDEGLLDDFSFRKIPMVVLDAGSVGPRISNITIDYEVGMMQAMQHLVNFGHKEIGFITGPLRLPSAQIRYSSFLSSRDSLRVAAHPGYVIRSDHSAAGGYQAIRQLLSVYPKVTAVICSNDLMAIGAMQAAHEMGLCIPQDISIVGYDDIHLSAFAHPSLTTVCVPRSELASIAFMSLQRLGETAEVANKGEQHRVLTLLVCRQSTAQVRA